MSSDHPPSSTGGEPTLRDLDSKINTLEGGLDSKFEAEVNKQFANRFAKVNYQPPSWYAKVNNQPANGANGFAKVNNHFAEVDNQLANGFAKVDNQLAVLSDQLVHVLNHLEGPRTIRALVVTD
ncbi:hypothetical protein L873DRAFT_1794336 [Choiromyces venosus 120613-1]|uniref:Uncharacterized protein n=1 Tax=Choiromyces venosus 120613-1 TaxID=1336337 RepID=A0A3N4JET0_9PEZI|nr:hypothetical protein L873DRAFT_1794336 [Choiromyces venosus 120613-1]